ncbi:MAG TPA: hypothetical protein VMT45_15130 [Thermoanaerobaculaceae bacterium]|nr:hypothetical protein [Thermoanaerobaculaceae bacterium]
MNTFARYLKALAWWAMLLALLSTAMMLVTQVEQFRHATETPIAQGFRLGLLIIAGAVGTIPLFVAAYLPVAGYAAGLGLVARDEPVPSPWGRWLARLVVLLLVTMLTEFVLLGYVAPALRVWLPSLATGHGIPPWQSTAVRPALHLWHEHPEFYARLGPVDPRVPAHMGMELRLQEAQTILTGILVLIGCLVGLATRGLPARRARLQHWAIGVLLVLAYGTAIPSFPAQAAFRLAGKGVAPTLAAYAMVLAVPATALIALMWAAQFRERHE